MNEPDQDRDKKDDARLQGKPRARSILNSRSRCGGGRLTPGSLHTVQDWLYASKSRTLKKILSLTGSIVAVMAGASAPCAAQTPLSFTKDIAPVVFAHCASCHRPGDIGPFSLLTGKPEPVQVSAGLFFTDQPPAYTPVGLRLGSETIDIRPGDRNYSISDRYTLPVDVDVLAVQPHAYNLARRMEATATLPDGTTRPLISIADWDFRWQDVYRYARPLTLPRGTTLSMRHTYDNSTSNPRNPSRPPREVAWGQNTTDEMGDLWVQIVPKTSSDLALLSEDIGRKTRADDLAAYTKLLSTDARNPLRHDVVALLSLQEGLIDQAVTHQPRCAADRAGEFR